MRGNFMNFDTWLSFLGQIIIIVMCLVLAIYICIYIRALTKRIKLLKTIKKICRNKSFTYKKSSSLIASVFSPSANSELIVDTGKDTYSIRFFACKKRKSTYVFKKDGSFYTTNNFNPILISMGHPSSYMSPKNARERRLFMSPFANLKNDFINGEGKGADFNKKKDSNIKQIICLNPISVEIRVIRTNQEEQIFDGDEFCGCIIYSGNGLCKFLSN